MKVCNFVLFVLLLVSCQKKSEDNLPILDAKSNSSLQYFGFTLVDVYFDDPTDSEVKTNYLDEVSTFSNLADILIVEPDQDIKTNLEAFSQHDVQAILHLHFLFFELKEEGGNMSGFVYKLRPDYIERWNTFVSTNNLTDFNDDIAAFYIGEEPTWNGISAEELNLASNLLDDYSSEIAIMIIEAYPVIHELEIPEKADWIGFDHYFIKRPSESAIYSSELSALRGKLQEDQQIMLVMDSHYIKEVHGSQGIDITDLDDIAADYYKIANESEDIIGILGYHWPSGFEFESTVGARHLSGNPQLIYRDMGKKITGK